MNGWKPRLIAVDIDGTLLNAAKELTTGTRAAIKRARQAGIVVIPCSGRPFFGTRAVAAQAGMDQVVVAGNGAQVRAFSGEMIENHPFDADKCRECLRLCMEFGLGCNLYADDTLYTRAHNSVTRYYERLNQTLKADEQCRYAFVTDLFETLERHAGGILKLEVFPVLPKAKTALLALIKSLGGIAAEGTLRSSAELHAAGVSKATGLMAAARYYDIPLCDAMAFGDAENDVELLRAAGRGVAMGNAAQEAKAAADEIAPDNDHDGVAEWIGRYL